MNSSTHPYEQEEVMAYLDGELSADRASGVAAHLRECAECAELAEQMRGVSVHLANWSVEPAPATLTRSLEAATASSLRWEKKMSRTGIAAWLDGKFAPLRGRWVVGALGAAAVAVLLLIVGVQNLRKESGATALSYVKAVPVDRPELHATESTSPTAFRRRVANGRAIQRTGANKREFRG